MLRKIFWLVLLVLFALGFSTSAFAENGWRYWKQGQVTKEVWREGALARIEVDNIPYTLMPDCRVFRIEKNRSGAQNEVQISKENVYQTQNVNMLIQGFRIYQLNVTP